MDINKIFQSSAIKVILLTIAILIILGFVFNAGMFIGMRKANFSFTWADEYHRNFGGPQAGFLRSFADMGKEFINSNGAVGQIININDQKITVKDRDNTEKIILITNETSIVRQKNNIETGDLKLNDFVVIIGEPNNNGQIDAKLIRVMPESPQSKPSAYCSGRYK